MSVVLEPPEVAERERLDAAPATPPAAGPPPTGSSTPARIAAWVAVVALLVGVVLAPPTGGALASGDFALVVSGTVERRHGSAWERVPVGSRVPFGTAVRTLDEPAELSVREGRLSLARWTQLVGDDDRIELTRGDLLLETDRARQVTYGALAASGRGTWRASATGTVRFAVYDGGVALRQPGGEEAVPVAGLREVSVTDGVTGGVRPLTYLPSDPWDARLLAEAIRIDRLLAATRRGLAARYGTVPQTEAFYADFARFSGLLDGLPRLTVVQAPADADGDARYGPPAETLVALVVAEALVAEGALEPAEAARRIDELRAAGAEWGLIAAEHGLTADDLDRTIERAVRQRGEAVAEGTAAPVLSPPAPTVPTTPETPSPPGPPPTTTPPEEPTRPTPPPGDDPEPPGDEPRPLDPVTDVVDDLGELLDDVVPGASEVTDTVNEVVEDVGDLLP